MTMARRVSYALVVLGVLVAVIGLLVPVSGTVEGSTTDLSCGTAIQAAFGTVDDGGQRIMTGTDTAITKSACARGSRRRVAAGIGSGDSSGHPRSSGDHHLVRDRATTAGNRAAVARTGGRITLASDSPRTRQATEDLLDRGASVQAVEIGPATAAKLRSKLASSRLEVTVGDFERVDLPPSSAYAVFSATAYHWISPPAQTYRPAAILRRGGVIYSIARMLSVGPLGEAWAAADDGARAAAVGAVLKGCDDHRDGDGWRLPATALTISASVLS